MAGSRLFMAIAVAVACGDDGDCIPRRAGSYTVPLRHIAQRNSGDPTRENDHGGLPPST
jgi:hypothetical protein